MALSKRTLLENTAAAVARLEGKINALADQQTQILTGVNMANAAITQLISDFNTETNAIQARLDALITQISTGVASPEQIAELQSISARLAALGADPTNPIPTT